MLTKHCRAPKGGSAVALAEYMTGYAIAGKGASKAEIRGALDGVYAEAEQRADLGVDAIWSPSAGHGTRPSSILVRNCASFSTAALEMDADAMSNPGVTASTMHLVTSFRTSESGTLTDEQVHEYVEEHLAKLGLAHHRYMIVVHRDTIVYDRNLDGSIKRDEHGKPIVKDGNIHAHIQVGAVDPVTGLAYDRTGLHRKISWADREVEIAHGLEHDRGLAMVRDAGLATQRIEAATPAELRAWRAERREERLLRLERRSFEGYRERDTTWERYADATVAPRLAAAVDTAGECGREIAWADLHTVAARYGAAIQRDAGDTLVLRDVGIGVMHYEHGREIIEMRRDLKEAGVEQDEIDAQIAERKAEHAKDETAEHQRKTSEGDCVPLSAVLPAIDALPEFRTIEESEREIAERVAADPKIVLRDVTAQSSTFSREDVDLWLCSRISDPEEIERLGDLVMRDDSIRVLDVDTPQALCTTTEILGVEDRLAGDARHLARTASGITREQIQRAISTYEREQTEKADKPFSLTGEQRKALLQIADGSLLSIEGLPGVGKTTVMGCVRVLGEQTGREVVGITLSQAAAGRLQSEAGFRAINSSRATLLEESGEQVIPQRGIVVVDEAAMMDSRANGRVLGLAVSRGCLVGEIYDTRQLQPIDFGASARIIRDAAREAGTHSELREIQRQKNEWHKAAVATMADAIAERDEAKRLALVKSALQTLDAHGAIKWTASRDEAIDTAVQTARINRALGYRDGLLIAADKDTVRHLAEEDRRRGGLEKKGLTFVTNGGTREVAVGDRLVFLENSLGKRGLGVLNGDRGEITEVRHDRIAVRMDGGDSVIEFNPRSYKAWDWGNSLSVHKSQGASVSDCVAVIDRAASAELAFVAMSRSKQSLSLVVAESSFKNLDELAEHISERISLKTTSRNYDEIVQRTGGKETLRVINIEAQSEALNSPFRRLWETECKEPARAVRDARIRELRKTYSARKDEIAADVSLSIEQRLRSERVALSEFRSAAALIYSDCRPQKYSDWLRAQERTSEIARELERQRQRERARTPEQRAQRKIDEITRQNSRIIDAGKTPQNEKEKGHEYGR